MRTEDSDKLTPLSELLNNAVFHMCAASIWVLLSIFCIVQFSYAPILIIIVPLVLMAYYLGNRISRTRLSTGAALAGALVVYLCSRLISFMMTSSTLLSTLLGSRGTYALSEIIFWSAVLGIVVFLSRFLSMRNPLFLALESVIIAAILTLPFWAHQMGYINRPLTLIDKTWYYGIDPRSVFLFIGIVLCFLFFFILSNNRKSKKSVLDIFIFSFLLLVLIFCIPFSKIQKMVSRGTGAGGKGEAKASLSPSPMRPSPGKGSSTPSPSPEEGKNSDNENDQTKMEDSTSSGSDIPVAVVNLHDDYTSPDDMYYFRQTAFSRYNGIRLVMDTEGADKDILDDFPQRETKVTNECEVPPESDRPVSGQKKAPPYKYIETSVALMTSHTRPFGLVNPSVFRPLENLDPDRFERIYQVGSYVRTKPYEEILVKNLGSDKWDEKLWALYTEAPTDPRYRELAVSIISQLKDEYKDNLLAQALAIKLWLDENCTYSRSCSHSGATDPTASFLFGDRVGYCVYLAHSACYLMRTLGIPSRLCGGYAVEERFRGGSSTILILGKYSHLWPEIYIEGLGWVIIDITPRKSLEPAEQAPDQNLQSMLGEMLRKSSKSAFENAPPQPRLQINFKPFLKALLFCLIAAIMLLYLIKLSRRLRPWFCSASELPNAAFISTLDILGEGGYIREFGETREGFADKLKEISPSFRALTDFHLSMFFGRETKKGLSKEQVLPLYRTIRSEISKKIPAVRKLMGLLNPISWLLTR